MAENKSAAIFCIDDDLESNNIVAFPLAGALVLGDEPTQKFSQGRFDLVHGIRMSVLGVTAQIANNMGLQVEILSHQGCGWAGLQGISEEDLPDLTAQLAQDAGISYGGHIVYAQEPRGVEMRSGELLLAWMNRPPWIHNHEASAVIVTLGGGITGSERNRVLAEIGADSAFSVSVDHLYSMDNSSDKEQALALIGVQLEIANSIIGSNLPIMGFDAKRLDSSITNANLEILSGLVPGIQVIK